MKSLLTCGLLVFFSSTAMCQRWSPEWNFGYVYSLPTLDMKSTIQDAHGMHMSLLWNNPNKRTAFGLEVNCGHYGHEKNRQDFLMDDGTTEPRDVIVDNQFTSLQGLARFNLPAIGSVYPYAVVKGGYSWYTTSLMIEDPDSDHCSSAEAETIQKDGAPIASVGGGFQVRLSSTKKQHCKIWYLDFQSSFITGGRVSYMNSDAPPPPQSANASRGDITAELVNTQPQVVHPNHTGNLYSSMINMMDFRIGLTLKPGTRD